MHTIRTHGKCIFNRSFNLCVGSQTCVAPEILQRSRKSEQTPPDTHTHAQSHYGHSAQLNGACPTDDRSKRAKLLEAAMKQCQCVFGRRRSLVWLIIYCALTLAQSDITLLSFHSHTLLAAYKERTFCQRDDLIHCIMMATSCLL